MKKITLLFLLISSFAFAQQQTVTYNVSPATFEENQSITITVNGSSINESAWAVTGNALYLWAWSFDQNYLNNQDCPTNGTWTSSNEANRLTYNAGTDTYSITFVPTTFFARTNIGRIGFLVKAKNGTGDKKSQDILVNVGTFQVNLTAPAQNSTTIIPSGGNLTVTATNTGGNAAYVLKANGTTINTVPSAASFSYNHTGITSNQNYVLEVTQGTTTITRNFAVVVNGGAIAEAMPAGLQDGVNYNPSDPTRATLVLNAPFKDFVYVAGTFNGYAPSTNHLMKKDPASGKFWLELTGLVSGTSYSYQYWVGDQTNRPANSPALVKTADPFSTLVLSQFDDPEIASLGVYPSLPAFPAGQEREVSVLQTGPNAYYQYNWSSATTNFVKPNKKDLVIYEVLVRDFDASRTYQDLINKIDYFKNLNINAIQLMPVMEFEGNESWGYNTAFHMALDKRYGSEAKLKEFIDLCHQNGIAVILDIALNHVYGRSPLERMWMTDTNNDGWADGITSENPYCNANAMHSYNVGRDLNHYREPENLTVYYVQRTIQRWMNDFKIDGFRWDLTKGFTQNCPYTGSGSAQDACTNAYQADRVAKLKYYADLQWAIDPNFYVIFEHLGTGGSYDEEVEWANYRKTGDADGISKGIMQWRKMTDEYANFLKGNGTNLTRVADATERFIGYAESHDEERVMYKALTEAGQTQGNLTKALARMPALGALHLLVPGPKMVYHFGSLGFDDSIFTCNNGTVNTPNDAISGDCKLDTKPQPQWTENWLGDTARRKIYDEWAKMIKLRINEPLFENGQHFWNFGTQGKPRLDVRTSLTPTTDLSYVIVLTNSTNNTAFTPGGFPYTGTWYNMITGDSFQVTNVNQNITIEADGYRVFGNKAPNLSNPTFEIEKITLYPNPSKGIFNLNSNATHVSVYSITGQLVKDFAGNFDANHQFNIESLNPGMYIVKVKTENNAESTLKLMKQ
ncbi:T9SS type A sorting domain-containing protein [Flavobacterium sp. NST-5]|uniref:T9SS type A sorting domain-containing protein n=1 Tax=Flavobacterium ichthyis TaxID=2698827 RepID=A0ABW9Z6U7_9FLAO|nr:alpha-amylase family glycosyl hydrolase [Flavobacterium ichthyis]NBL64598.1 T9SS type A sorting domain-containing protein [Flavobacterium ichthyis]